MNDVKSIKKIIDKNQKLILTEIKQLNEKLDSLNTRLNSHISFIESVYNPLTTSIERFKKFFK